MAFNGTNTESGCDSPSVEHRSKTSNAVTCCKPVQCPKGEEPVPCNKTDGLAGCKRCEPGYSQPRPCPSNDMNCFCRFDGKTTPIPESITTSMADLMTTFQPPTADSSYHYYIIIAAIFVVAAAAICCYCYRKKLLRKLRQLLSFNGNTQQASKTREVNDRNDSNGKNIENGADQRLMNDLTGATSNTHYHNGSTNVESSENDEHPIQTQSNGFFNSGAEIINGNLKSSRESLSPSAYIHTLLLANTCIRTHLHKKPCPSSMEMNKMKDVGSNETTLTFTEPGKGDTALIPCEDRKTVLVNISVNMDV